MHHNPTISDLAEDAPPAYTPAPDVYQGESTVERGPPRPFQPAPQQRAPASGRLTPASGPSPSVWRQLTGLASRLDSTYPGQTSYLPPPHPPPPPPSLAHRRYSPPPQPPPPPRMSDFARDFYATTHIPPFSAASATSSTQHLPPAAPAPQSAQSQYEPPPGVPPLLSPDTASIPDDGRPTTTPIPGHPLLRGGQMLAFPLHFECPMCNNTGYKHADPAQPCARCWDRFARPYVGAVARDPAARPRSRSRSHSRHRSAEPAMAFQRPLPRPAAAAPASLAPPGMQYAPPSGAPAPRSRPASASYVPGDARLGGARCWRCGGRGTVSFLGLFETQACGEGWGWEEAETAGEKEKSGRMQRETGTAYPPIAVLVEPSRRTASAALSFPGGGGGIDCLVCHVPLRPTPRPRTASQVYLQPALAHHVPDPQAPAPSTRARFPVGAVSMWPGAQVALLAGSHHHALARVVRCGGSMRPWSRARARAWMQDRSSSPTLRDVQVHHPRALHTPACTPHRDDLPADERPLHCLFPPPPASIASSTMRLCAPRPRAASQVYLRPPLAHHVTLPASSSTKHPCAVPRCRCGTAQLRAGGAPFQQPAPRTRA
ncbi:hypothetical protein GGX14DRAFT_608584 [Mycena pura]|uniref:Uncharacterized protein n=1 Tax=Mycena pura TaxID=153505 RepID=A0AAD6VNQ4_9AGAR|nr:hypothetical protein GGX14DRAFT_608584 [Mycena pura]